MIEGRVVQSCSHCLACKPVQTGKMECALRNPDWTPPEDPRWETEEKICCVANMQYIFEHDPVIAAEPDEEKKVVLFAERYGYEYT